jgi:hypothetical protein
VPPSVNIMMTSLHCAPWPFTAAWRNWNKITNRKLKVYFLSNWAQNLKSLKNLPANAETLLNLQYSGTSLSGHLCLEDTSLLSTQTFSPKLVISIHFDLCNQDTSQLRTAVVSPKGVLNREVSL